MSLFLLASLSDVDLVSPRYWAFNAPALAALMAVALSSIERAGARAVIAVTLVAIAVVGLARTGRVVEEWRGAADAARAQSGPQTPSATRPGLVESSDPSWLRDPERAAYLAAPSSYYDFGGSVRVLPYVVTEEVTPYLQRSVRFASHEDRFYLVTRNDGEGIAAWLEGWSDGHGWESRFVGLYPSVFVVEFTRSADEQDS